MPDASLRGIEFVIKGNADSASNSVKKLIDRLNGLNSSLRSSNVSQLSNAFKVMKNDIASMVAPLKKVGAAIKRIVFYRAIRFAIKQITDAFQVGLQNAYQFSKLTGYELANAMDTIATKSLTMKNQMGAAFGGLITAIEPIVLRLIALVTKAANAIAQLMAILGGKSTYLKAVDTMQQWGEAVGGAGAAAKEAMKYLAPFDELNVLPDDKNGGGGGGGGVPDYSAMFEETPVSQALQDFISDFKISVNDVLFDWNNLTGEQIAEKALAGLFALTGAGVGFILGGVPGAIIGSIIGLTLGLVADTLVFNHDGVLSKSEIGHSLQYVLNALAGGIVGFVVGGPGGALIGMSIGLGISLIADIFDFKAASQNKNSVWLDQLTVALSALAGGAIGFSVGGPAGALIGAAIGIGVSAVIESIKFNKKDGILEGQSGRSGLDYFIVDVLGLPSDEQWEKWGENVWKSVKGGLDKGWEWFTEGIRDFGKELASIFVDPVVDGLNSVIDKVNEYISAHPKIANWLGLEQIDHITLNLTPELNPSAKQFYNETKKDLETASEKKPLNLTGNANLKTADVTEINGTSVETNAEFTYYTKNFKSGTYNSNGSTPTIPSIAQFWDYQRNFGSGTYNNDKVTPIINSRANLTSYGKNFASGTVNNNRTDPIIDSRANFTSRNDYSLNKTFESTANFTKRDISGLNVTIPTLAGFYSYIRQFDTPTMSVLAGFYSYVRQFDTPTMAALAAFINYLIKFGTPEVESNTDLINPRWRDGTPYMEVNAILDPNNPGNVLGGWGYATGGAYYGGTWHDIPQAASGGKFHGTLFWAGENGAEVVGHAGGRTEVLNRSQLAATMYAAVHSAMSGIAFNVSAPSMATGTADDGANEDTLYRAFLRALNDSDFDDRPIELDGEVIYRNVVNHNKQEKRRSGLNPMLTV